MRGKPVIIDELQLSDGITPADAGKTFYKTNITQLVQDHPRGCGENYWLSPLRRASAGSPPRMRGKLYVRFFNRGGNRITPADAGKTQRQVRKRIDVQDHPRGCGENKAETLEQSAKMGSPPRMRGKLLEKIGIEKENGITPADAGKTHF